MRRTAWAIGCCVIGAATASLTPLAFAPRAGAAAAEGTRTTLITAGRAPRSPLRHALTKGSVSDVTMEMTQSIEQSLDGKSTNSVQTPPISFGTQTTVDAVAADGNAQITSSYHDIAVVDDGSFTAAQRAQLQSGLAPLTAMKVAATITTRNVYVASTVTGAEGLRATTAQLVEQSRNSRRISPSRSPKKLSASAPGGAAPARPRSPGSTSGRVTSSRCSSVTATW